MSGEAAPSSNTTSEICAVGTESAVAESKTAPSSSSSTMADQAMARKEISPLYEYWRALTVTDKDIIVDWLLGVLLYNPPHL
jgi:hypothetical protein